MSTNNNSIGNNTSTGATPMNNENAATEQLTNSNGVGMPVVASCNSLNDDMGIDWDDALVSNY